jgi:hypothetical protein
MPMSTGPGAVDRCDKGRIETGAAYPDPSGRSRVVGCPIIPVGPSCTSSSSLPLGRTFGREASSVVTRWFTRETGSEMGAALGVVQYLLISTDRRFEWMDGFVPRLRQIWVRVDRTSAGWIRACSLTPTDAGKGNTSPTQSAANDDKDNNERAAMPGLPEDLPFGDDVEDEVGPAAAKPNGPSVRDIDSSTTAHTSCSSESSSCFDALERGHENEEEDHERWEGRRLEKQMMQQQMQQQKAPAESRPGNGWTRRWRCCCEWAADAFLAALAVTYVVTSVLVVVRFVEMLLWVVLSVPFILMWTGDVWRSPRRVERSLLASVPFFYFGMINLAIVTGSPVPYWLLVGVWVSPFAILLVMMLALVAYAAAMALARAGRAATAAATRSCAATWAKVRTRRSDEHGNGCDGREPPLPQAAPAPLEEVEHRRRPPSPCP